MDWNDLRYLLAVHRRGSLAAAAKDLGVTKATMSRRLAALEEALGTRLVDRKPAGLSLTATGREVVGTAEQMERSAAALEGRVAATTGARPSGTVRLTAPQWLAAPLLIPALPDLKALYPELDVQLLGTNQILNLAQHEADLAIRNVRPTHASLAARKIVPLGGRVYASKLYLERRGVPCGPTALSGHDVLVYEGLGGMPGFEWMRQPSHGGNVAFRANDPEALASAAAAGLGLAAVPCIVGDRNPALAAVETLGTGRCDMYLVSHEQARDTPRVRVVASFVVEHLTRHRAVLDPTT